MKNELAVVTGGARRIGRALAIFLAQQGYSILLHYFSSIRDVEVTYRDICSMGVPVYKFSADLTKDAEINNLLSFSNTLPCQTKVLINSASIMIKNDISSTTIAEWDYTFALNLRAPFLLTQKFAATMIHGGLVVNITDVGAGMLWQKYSAYVVSKSALETLTRLLAKSYAPSIRVNAIAPGLVLPSRGIRKEEWQRLVDRLPLKRATDLTELTSALGFLLANDAITGQVITVDGGYSLV